MKNQRGTKMVSNSIQAMRERFHLKAHNLIASQDGGYVDPVVLGLEAQDHKAIAIEATSPSDYVKIVGRCPKGQTALVHICMERIEAISYIRTLDPIVKSRVLVHDPKADTVSR
jgi:hypothetical protein